MGAADYLLLMLLALLILAFLTHVLRRRAAIGARERVAELYTVVRCDDGIRKRKYQEGDFVGKQTQECAGGLIVGIFKEVLRQP
jgi:hypothetical protein